MLNQKLLYKHKIKNLNRNVIIYISLKTLSINV